MNKKISFKHITGSMKFIPGLDTADMQPRMITVHRTHPDVGAKPFPELQLVKGHIVHIVLVNEDYQPLSEADAKLPESVRTHLEQEHADDMIMRRSANTKVRDALLHLARTNEIEIIGETDLDDQDVVDTEYPIISLSAIALADFEARGIPIPTKLQNPAVDVERLRAADEIARKKADKKNKED